MQKCQSFSGRIWRCFPVCFSSFCLCSSFCVCVLPTLWFRHTYCLFSVRSSTVGTVSRLSLPALSFCSTNSLFACVYSSPLDTCHNQPHPASLCFGSRLGIWTVCAPACPALWNGITELSQQANLLQLISKFLNKYLKNFFILLFVCSALTPGNSESLNIQLHKWDDLLLFFVIYKSKLNKFAESRLMIQ